MKNKLLLLALLVLIINKSRAQQAYPVTDTVPAMVNGLQMGFHIKSVEVKAVSDKGNFSRYSISFYVTNMNNMPIILPYREGWNQPGNTSDLLARFDISNATGARLTSKTALIKALPYKTFVLVDERDPQSNRMIKVKRFTQVGYFIQPGQSISVDEIVIVPLNQLPNVQVVYFGNALPPNQPVVYSPNQPVVYPPNQPVVYTPNPRGVQNTPPVQVNMQGFLKFRNVFNNTYINIQNGPPTSSPIDNGWWSAQWQLTPVQGTNYFNIKNRWKGNFMDTDRGYVVVSANPQSPGSMWSMEPTQQDPNVFRIKNAKTGGYLCIANNNLILSINAGNGYSAAWHVEQPQ